MNAYCETLLLLLTPDGLEFLTSVQVAARPSKPNPAGLAIAMLRLRFMNYKSILNDF